VSQITADFSGAFRKTQILGRVPKATKFQATSWTAETIKELKRSAADRQLSAKLHHGKKTSQMGRNIGQSISTGADKWSILIGTGVGGKQSVKYALIQDQGGVTHPKVTKKMRGWAWYMYKQWGEERYKWLALTKKSELNIVIPASQWFTSIIEKRKPELAAMMSPAAVLRVAEIVSSGK
jgi:hypothetical protein